MIVKIHFEKTLICLRLRARWQREHVGEYRRMIGQNRLMTFEGNRGSVSCHYYEVAVVHPHEAVLDDEVRVYTDPPLSISSWVGDSTLTSARQSLGF